MGLEVLLVQVERATHAPVTFRGVPYERVLNTTRIMPRATYQRLLIESLNATDRWEMQPAVGCGIDTLDQRELVVTIEEAIRRGRMEDPGTRDPMGLLRGLGLLVQGDQISRAAIALFCKDDHSIREFPQFNLRVARFKGTTRDEFLDNRQYSGNAFALMRRAERFLIDWMPVAGKIVPGQMARIDTPALPVETLGKTPDLILLWLAEAPGASIPELAKHLGKSDSAIERAIRKLRVDGKLIRIGPAKSGHWQVRQ